MSTAERVKFSAAPAPRGLFAFAEYEKAVWGIVRDKGMCSRDKIDLILKETRKDIQQRLESTRQEEEEEVSDEQVGYREALKNQLRLYDYCTSQLAAILRSLVERAIIVEYRAP